MTRIAEFLEQYPKVSTRKTYRSGLRLFFDIAYKSERVNDDLHYEQLADRYFQDLESGQRKMPSDMIALADALTESPPLTARTRIASVKEFMACSGHEMTHRDVKNVHRRIQAGYSQSEEADLDHDTLKSILQHCDLRGRALFLALVSSGMRIGEAIQITLSDIDLDRKPARINIKAAYTKTREARVTFISEEATEAVRAWLQIRTAHMASATSRNAGLVAHGLSTEKKANDTRLFPYQYGTVVTVWTNAVTAANLFSKDETTGRAQLHIHQLRKYFRTMTATKIPVDLVEAILGHSAYLSKAYRKYSREQLADFYLKAEPSVTIFTTDDPETRQRVSSLEAENRALKAKIDEIGDLKEVIKDAAVLFGDPVVTAKIEAIKKEREVKAKQN